MSIAPIKPECILTMVGCEDAFLALAGWPVPIPDSPTLAERPIHLAFGHRKLSLRHRPDGFDEERQDYQLLLALTKEQGERLLVQLEAALRDNA